MMKRWIDRILVFVAALSLAVLTATVVPWMTGDHLEGPTLLLHMAASGGLVVSLPLLAVSLVWRHLRGGSTGAIQRLAFWVLMIAGTLTIASVFLCMLPLPSTQQMHALMRVHSYTGFAMLPAMLLWIAAATGTE